MNVSVEVEEMNVSEVEEMNVTEVEVEVMTVSVEVEVMNVSVEVEVMTVSEVDEDVIGDIAENAAEVK